MAEGQATIQVFFTSDSFGVGVGVGVVSGVRTIRTFPFLPTPLTTRSLTFRL